MRSILIVAAVEVVENHPKVEILLQKIIQDPDRCILIIIVEEVEMLLRIGLIYKTQGMVQIEGDK
tara:strand:- start:185 stop:379 length:195 start_codon:yes stop_codon:yes gene_type:complete